MSFIHETTARSRELGAELRRARKRAGFKGAQMAGRLTWSTSKVSRLETGRRGAAKMDVVTYLAACGVFGVELERISALAEPLETDYWVQPNEPIPDELRSLITLENTAQAISYYELGVIPGLLQTEGYMRALFEGVGVIPESGIDPCVQARLARQRILDGIMGPQVDFLIHENALWTPVGDDRVMHDQMLHLLFLSEQGRCRVRIVPRQVGSRAACLTGPFVFFKFDEHPPTVYLEHYTASMFLDQGKDVRTYRKLLSSLVACALPEGESRSMLANVASAYDRP